MVSETSTWIERVPCPRENSPPATSHRELLVLRQARDRRFGHVLQLQPV